MKPIIEFIVYSLITGITLLISCKREISCEGFKENKKRPSATAGPGQVIILPTDSIFPDGSASGDPDGRITSFLWTKISGPASFTISNSSVSNSVVKNLGRGVYQFELKITDMGGLFGSSANRFYCLEQEEMNILQSTISGSDSIKIL